MTHTIEATLGLPRLSHLITETDFLQALESGHLSQKQWRDFAIQRYCISKSFELLLRSGLEKARELQDVDLASALQNNLNDEEGVDEHGQPTALGPHESWREYFYMALGITKEELSTKVPEYGAKIYIKTLETLMQKGLALEIAGALLFLEYNIPLEFMKIKTGRDITFKNAFVLSPSDSPDIQNTKRRARMYIDHHIGHDGEQHYPDITHALKKYMSNLRAVEEIKNGIEKIADAKKSFYELLS